MSLPLALQSPTTDFPIRSVRRTDIDALRFDVWSHRTLSRSRNLITRIMDAKRFKRGLGVVVLDKANDERIIGYGQIMYWTQCAEVSDLVVSESYRSQGIGTAIIQHLIQNVSRRHSDCVEIGVAQSNPRAAYLYRKLGFEYYTTLELQIGGNQAEAVEYLRIKLT